ncbi:unnamed protein product [Prorocentrum cordatum]|uniref:Pentatricopeptide repeat-containing protein, chloroplastic n=1 Tax=Prorocentrum cordatum TaxID=2364126 RepID=A0ABN9RPM0_9DINO|nr:unnamed protein product [Polarella glacialis]
MATLSGAVRRDAEGEAGARRHPSTTRGSARAGRVSNGNALWRCSARCGRRSWSPTSSIFNAGIIACEKGEQWQWSLALLSEMREASLEPNVISYNAGISACGQGEQWHRAVALLRDMWEAKLEPTQIQLQRWDQRVRERQTVVPGLAAAQRDVGGEDGARLSYSAGISACEKGKQWQRALVLLSEMTEWITYLNPTDYQFFAQDVGAAPVFAGNFSPPAIEAAAGLYVLGHWHKAAEVDTPRLSEDPQQIARPIFAEREIARPGVKFAVNTARGAIRCSDKQGGVDPMPARISLRAHGRRSGAETAGAQALPAAPLAHERQLAMGCDGSCPEFAGELKGISDRCSNVQFRLEVLVAVIMQSEPEDVVLRVEELAATPARDEPGWAPARNPFVSGLGAPAGGYPGRVARAAEAVQGEALYNRSGSGSPSRYPRAQAGPPSRAPQRGGAQLGMAAVAPGLLEKAAAGCS